MNPTNPTNQQLTIITRLSYARAVTRVARAYARLATAERWGRTPALDRAEAELAEALEGARMARECCIGIDILR
jgi:hypothetical protein